MSTPAEELARVLAEHGCDYEDCASCGPVDDLAEHQAAVVLAHLHRVVTTAAELDALGDDAVIRDHHGDLFEKAAGKWYTPGQGAAFDRIRALPVTLLQEGEK